MPVEFKLPDLGEGIHEGEILEILVRIGDQVQDGQTVLIVETDKAAVEVPSPVTGTVEEIRVKPGETAQVGDVLMVFMREGESPREAPKPAPSGVAAEEKSEARPPEQGEKEAAPKSSEGPVAAAPSTRRLARELDVDIRMVSPSGPAGRVMPDDVRAFAEQGKKPEPAAKPVPRAEYEKSSVPPPAPPLPQFDHTGQIERVPLRSVRRATAKHLALAWSQIPHVSHMDVADITELEQFRRKHAQKVADQGGALTFTVFVLKAAVAALKKFPRFNASLDTEAEEIILKHYYNIGVAADTDRGLIVPVIRDVDRKSISELAIELKQAAEKARQGKTGTEDMSGGSFTVTNIGPLGGTAFTPIINYPQVAILGMARARLQPVVMGDEHNPEIVPRLMLPLVITFDHRILDGAEGARFLNLIIEALQNPENLLMVV